MFSLHGCGCHPLPLNNHVCSRPTRSKNWLLEITFRASRWFSIRVIITHSSDIPLGFPFLAISASFTLLYLVVDYPSCITLLNRSPGRKGLVHAGVQYRVRVHSACSLSSHSDCAGLSFILWTTLFVYHWNRYSLNNRNTVTIT